MKKFSRLALFVFLFLFLTNSLNSQSRLQGFVETGNFKFSVSSSARVQQSFPSATVTVFDAGTVNLATIYSNSSLTPKSNPFTADSTGYWFFYALNGKYDIQFSHPLLVSPITLADVVAYDLSGGGGGGGISNLNTQTGGTQTFVVGTSGTDFNISSASNVHTFNIPSASAANRGLISTSAQDFAGFKTFLNGLVFAGTSAPTLSSSGQIKFYYNSSDNKFYASRNGGAFEEFGVGGTVSSVGITAPAEITVTNSPITSSGNIGLSWTSRAANLAFMSPNGSAGTPSFRSPVSADISDATSANTTNTIVKRDSSGNFLANSISGTSLTSTNLTSGSVIFAGSGGLLNQDTSNLVYDNTNKRLGIGTNSAVTTLDVRNADSPTFQVASTTNTQTPQGRAAFNIGRVSGAGGLTGWQWLKDTDDSLLLRSMVADAPTSRLFVSTTGQLGINKFSSLGANLHVVAPSLTEKSFIAESATGSFSAINEFFQVKNPSSATSFAIGNSEGAATNANRIDHYADFNVPVLMGNDNAIDQNYTASAYHWGLRIRDGFSGNPNTNFNKYAGAMVWKNLGNLTASTIGTTDAYGVTTEVGISDTLNTFNWYQISGLHGVAFVFGSGNVDFLQGNTSNANHNGSGTVGSARGVTGFVQNLSTGTITLAHGGKFSLRSAGAGIMTTAYTIKADTPIITAGSITNLYGLYIGAHTGGTSTNFNLYSEGATSKNVFEGNVYSGANGSFGNITPAAWGSLYTALAIGNNHFIAGQTALGASKDLAITQNARYDGTNWKYISTDTASHYLQFQGSHFFRVAASGTAGNNITWTDAAQINNTGIFNSSSGAAVASAAAIVPTGNLFHVTGTTTITSITSTGINAGTEITIIFDGVLTFTDGSNLKLNGNFVTSADDTITLKFDGTNWFETARSAN